MQTYIKQYFSEMTDIINKLNVDDVEKLLKAIVTIRENKGRLFFIGVGGSAANASHAVNDFRKIAGIQSYTPTDNVSELTARINDEGWEGCFQAWLTGCVLTSNDGVFVLSVGGGSKEKNVSVNIVNAVIYAKKRGAQVLGIVGRDGGFTATVADACVIVPTVNNKTITPHTEAFQGVVWHLLVSHPALQKNEMKWESVVPATKSTMQDAA